jgi:hypothetical protein
MKLMKQKKGGGNTLSFTSLKKTFLYIYDVIVKQKKRERSAIHYSHTHHHHYDNHPHLLLEDSLYACSLKTPLRGGHHHACSLRNPSCCCLLLSFCLLLQYMLQSCSRGGDSEGHVL